MAREKKECNAPDCKNMTASKVGFCGKHFYMSNLVGSAKGRPPKRHLPRTIKTRLSSGHANGTVTLELSEAQLNRLILALPAAKKAEIVAAALEGD